MTSPSGLWGEGDPLSPTNLNRRNPAGNFPAKTYHVAWAAGTGTTQINNAITNAVAGGYTYLFLDASHLPYDATLVNHPTATAGGVRFVREGQGSWEEFDVKAYGASGTANATYDYPGCHAAEVAAGTWAAAGVTGGTVVNVPLGIYTLSEPWQITARGVTIRGQGYVQFNRSEGMTKLRGSYAYGPLMMVGNWTIPTTTALIGTGSALRFADDTYGWFNLRDARTLDVNGLSAFTIEGFVSFDTLTNAVTRTICRSKGLWRLNDTLATAFTLKQEPFGGTTRLSGTLHTTGGTVSVVSAGGALSAATTYHVALSWDGANLRLFAAIPGSSSAVLASSACTGTIVQDASEDVFLGPEMRFTPDGYNALTNGFGATGGTLDSFRISNSARYTGTFTAPTAKFVNDANTLLLMNFDKQVGPMTRAYTMNGDAYLVHRPFTAFGTTVITANGQGSSCEICNIGFDDTTTGHTGIVLGSDIVNVKLRRLRGFECRVGINVFPNSFFFQWEDCLFQESGGTGVRYGIQIGNNTSYASIIAVTVVGYLIPFVTDGGHTSNDNLNILTGTNSLAGLLIRGSEKHGSWVFNDLYVDTEAGTAAGYLGGILLTMSLAPETALFNGGIVEGARSIPSVYCDTWSSAIFSTTAFSDNAGASTIMAVNASGKPTMPVQFNACPILGTWIPWSDTTGTAVVGRLGANFSSSTGSTLLFDASVADEWDLTLTSDVTQSSWSKINYGQPVSGAIKMDSTGSRLFVWPTNSKGTATLSYGSAAVNTFTGFYDGVNVILTSVRTGL